jgi:hypothetical protein
MKDPAAVRTRDERLVVNSPVGSYKQMVCYTGASRALLFTEPEKFDRP